MMIRVCQFVASVVLVAALCASPTLGQDQDADISSPAPQYIITPENPTISALGDPIWGPDDIETPTGDNGCLGVVYLDGIYTVSGRCTTGLCTAGHSLHRFDADRQFIESVRQVPEADAGPWGGRDGATDGEFIYFGFDTGVARYDADGTNGVMQITGAAPAGVGVYRGLEYDADLDDGNGGFWTASFGSALINVDMSGNLLNTYNNTCGWSIYGIAMDPCTGNLWVSTVPNDGQICEVDRDGFCTGVCFDRANMDPVGSQGGLSGLPGDDGSWNLVSVFQYTPDSLNAYEVYPEGCEGTTCSHIMKKNSKNKKGCKSCPQKGDSYDTGVDCDDENACPKKFKAKKVDCPNPDAPEKAFCKKLIAEKKSGSCE